MNNGVVHLVATVIWGLFGIVIGSIALIYGQFNTWVGLALISAITGNSAHLVTFSLSKTGVDISSSQEKKVN
jgi:hypothetical protein